MHEPTTRRAYIWCGFGDLGVIGDDVVWRTAEVHRDTLARSLCASPDEVTISCETVLYDGGYYMTARDGSLFMVGTVEDPELDRYRTEARWT